MAQLRLSLALVLALSVIQAHAASLLDLFQETMASDPRLLRAEAESAIYQAREGYAFGGLLPQVTAGAQGTRTSRDITDQSGADSQSYYNGERYYVSLNQPLYNKSAWEAYRSADRESDQFTALMQDTQSVVAVDLVYRYTQVLSAEDNHTFVVAERKAAEEQLKLVQARHDRQLASITDLLSVEARTNILRSQELDSLNQVAIARENMSEVLGRELFEPLASLKKGLEVDWQPGVPDEWVDLGLSSNKQLEASRLAVESARLRVKEAAGQRHPALSLSLNAQQSDIGFENAQTPEATSYVAAVNLTMPLYSGGRISSQVAEAKGRLRLAEQEYEQNERLFRKNIREAYLRAKGASERVGATRKAVSSAEKSYEAQQRGFEYGTVTVVDVLDASEILFGARRDYHQAFYDLMLQAMTLFQVAGQFSPEKVAEMDSWLASNE